ncbi:MAG: hypothetical protein GQ534_12455 [Candidatus Delongbacteria bacterium]|nr:hypothetical protein [Candidatus Delongbacteria bacterium]
MKKLLLILLIVASFVTAPVYADGDPYPDWDWIDGGWVYVGGDNPPLPPPPPTPPGSR